MRLTDCLPFAFITNNSSTYPLRNACVYEASPYDFRRFTKFGLQLMFESFEIVELSTRNTYFQAIYVLLVRTFVVGDRKSRRRARVLSPLILLALYPLLRLLDRTVRASGDATTGYFFVIRKPKEDETC